MNTYLKSGLMVLGLICLTIATVFFRQSIHTPDTIYQNYDATYHALLTSHALQETPISQHHMLPIVSLGNESDKNITWGATIPDEHGNYYYTSFPIGGFIAPYLFFEAFNLDTTVSNLLIFSSLVLIASVIMFYLLTLSISSYLSVKKPAAVSFISSLVYIFSLETLYSHGYIYWGHSLMQPFYIGFLYIIFKAISHTETKYTVHYLLGLSFLMGFIEWSGYLISLGAILALALSKISKGDKYRFILSCSIGSALALLSYILLSIFTYNPTDFLSALADRFIARGITHKISLWNLVEGYWSSYYLFVLLVPAGLFLLFKTKNISTEKKRAILCSLCIIAFGLAENIIMKQHAITYHFDRLKFLPLLALTIPIIFISSSYINKWLCSLLIIGTSAYSLYQYPQSRIQENEALTHNLRFLEENAFSTECSSCVVGVDVRVRGYINLLFNRGVYEKQTRDSIKAIGQEQGKCSCYVDIENIDRKGMIKINGYERLSLPVTNTNHDSPLVNNHLPNK